MAKKMKASKTLSSTPRPSANRRQQMMMLAAVVGVALLVVAAVILVNREAAGETKSLEEYDTYAGIPLGGQFVNARNIDRGSDVVEGVEMGINEDGIPYVGSPDAPFVLGEFADFTCPACGQYHDTVSRLIKDFVRSGQLRVEFYVLPAPNRAPPSQHSARAALCAGRQGAFWEMHDELFRIQAAEGIDEFTPENLQEVGEKLGLDGDELRECMNSNQADAGISTARRLALDIGADATPTLIYRLNDSERWNTFPSEQGIGGGRPYEMLASLIQQATEG